MNLDGRLSYRLVMAIDIEGYSRRNAEQQRCAQTDLCHVLDSAAGYAGVDRGHWHRQNAGDGELAVLPADIDVSRVIGDLVREIDRALAELNRGRPAHRRLRVRLAFHHGTLTNGPLGPAGDAPIVASRLLDLDAGRQHLRTYQDVDIVVIVSVSLYKDVVSTGYCSMLPADFEHIQAEVKGVTYDGYMYRGRARGKNGAGLPHRREQIMAGARSARHTALKHKATARHPRRPH